MRSIALATRIALSITALTGAACGTPVLAPSDTVDADGASSGLVDASDAASVAPFAVSFTGRYIVPPQSAVSTSDVDELHWIVAGDAVVLAYNLPRILVGDRIRVAVAGTLDATHTHATLSGAAGTAECQVRASDLALSRCDERFTSITPDFDRVREVAMNLDPQNVDARLDVAQRFSNEPIGVLEIGTVIPGSVVACTSSHSGCPEGTTCHLEAADLGVCAPPDA